MAPALRLHLSAGQNRRLSGLVAAVASVVSAGPALAAGSGCNSAQSHQFDFWVGRWRVSPTAHPEKHVADSLIEKLYQGCGVRENWSPLKGGAGGSLSAYVPADPGWRQTWVDADGAYVEFKGAWNGKAMVLTGRWPQPGHPRQLTRMTYTRGPDASVRQLGEVSDDGGRSWSPGFDFTYRRAN
jgi:hypothetical protein